LVGPMLLNQRQRVLMLSRVLEPPGLPGVQ
jgi:hypothetical protein